MAEKNVTQLLWLVADGDDQAIDRLLPVVYAELRHMARKLMTGERRDHTLQPTALVNEAYLKLVDQGSPRAKRFEDRTHFFAVAAQAMRRILVDHARTKGRLKRVSGAAAKVGGRRVSLDEDIAAAVEQSVDLVALDEAMNKLAALNANAARVVELRYFGGLTIEQTALVMGLSESSVEREWTFARAWLHHALGEGDSARAAGNKP